MSRYHSNPLRSTCLVLFLFLGAGLAFGAPANDDIANAISLTGTAGSVSGSNTDASAELGEPLVIDGASVGRSVWCRWTASRNGKWSFNTLGSSFNTAIAVYGDANFSAPPLAANNDIDVGEISSQLSIQATTGATYFIRIAGVNASQGDLVLNWLPAPANDDFVNSVTISGETGTIKGSNIGASLEFNEPSVPLARPRSTGASVWYRWTAPRSGLVFFDTAESNFDTILAVFTGDALDALTVVGATDDSAPDGSSMVSFQPSAGTTYSIAVYSRGVPLVTDRFTIRWAYIPGAAPANDNFAQAQQLSGDVGSVYGVNFGATREPGEFSHASTNTIGASVWYSWTAPASGIVIFDALGSSFNNRLACYSGNSVANLTLITNNEVSGSGPFSAPVTAGTAYRVVVDGYLDLRGNPPFHSPTGRVCLNWLMVPSIPVNDSFNSPVQIAGSSGSLSGSNFQGSKEPGEPRHAASSGGASIWYRWTAPSSARYFVGTQGSGFDTLLAIYIGNSVNSLQLVADNDDQHTPIRTSGVSFNSIAGTQYMIAVDGYLPEDAPAKTGRLQLHWGLNYIEAPVLSIAKHWSQSEAILSWNSTPGFILQATPNLTTPIWTGISNITQSGGTSHYTNLIQPGGMRFFRLAYP